MKNDKKVEAEVNKESEVKGIIHGDPIAIVTFKSKK